MAVGSDSGSAPSAASDRASDVASDVASDAETRPRQELQSIPRAAAAHGTIACHQGNRLVGRHIVTLFLLI